ncbi:MAG: Hint domain-containing protein [Rhodobacteraceae bacterium]|nr:Hint domain-containing protein [Paracoccaceae bacterium]
MDDGPQPIRWIGSRDVLARGNFAPIKIKAGALDNTRDLLVSPQHRMLLTGWRMELLFAERQVLATAKSLVNDESIRPLEGGTVEYFHMLFDRHQIVFAEGIPSESLHPGLQAMNSFNEETRDEIFALFPELRSNLSSYGAASRHSLKHFEGMIAAKGIVAIPMPDA